jgi:hypothetical protein
MPTFTVIQANAQDKIFETSAGPGLWTLAEEYLTVTAFLKIEVVDPEAVWQYAQNQYCNAGGTIHNDLASILPSAPIGALIAKLGGSSADFPPPANAAGQQAALPSGIRLFTVGSFTIISTATADSGPLYLAMNDTLAGFPNHAGKMKVKISLGA